MLDPKNAFDRMIVLDFETTGLRPCYQAVEVAWIEFDENLNELDSVSSLINTTIEIEPGAQRTHGISAAMLVGKPTLDDFIKTRHAGKFANEHVLVVAHYAAYDLPLFEKYCKKVTTLCTMKLGQALYPDAPNHKLQTLASLLNVKIKPNHRALTDASTCFHLLQQYSLSQNKSLKELISITNAPTQKDTMPFGKHKGEKIVDLPKDYLNWISQNIEPTHWIHQVIKNIQ